MKLLWAISIGIAAALTLSGIHAKTVAELSHGEAGMYRQMPGIFLGLFIGFFLDSETAVIVVTIAVNAALYFVLLRLVLRIWRKAS